MEGDQTDWESRSAGHGAATRLIAMDITIHASFLPHNADGQPAGRNLAVTGPLGWGWATPATCP
jgi:hypothetical protein